MYITGNCTLINILILFLICKNTFCVIHFIFKYIPSKNTILILYYINIKIKKLSHIYYYFFKLTWDLFEVI